MGSNAEVQAAAKEKLSEQAKTKAEESKGKVKKDTSGTAHARALHEIVGINEDGERVVHAPGSVFLSTVDELKRLDRLQAARKATDDEVAGFKARQKADAEVEL